MRIFAPLDQFDSDDVANFCEPDIIFDLMFGDENGDIAFTIWVVLFLLYIIVEFYLIPFFFYIDDAENEEEIKSLDNGGAVEESPLLVQTFWGLFTANFLGLVPYSQANACYLLAILTISLLVILTLWFQFTFEQKILINNAFLPNGTPLLIIPFVIIIEAISNLSRILSLAVRLFANLTSGHTLLKILTSFGLGTLVLIGLFKFLLGLPILIIIVIIGLEIIIAYLQAYVLVVLSLIYIAELEE